MDDSKKAPPAPMYFQHTVKYSGETLAAISEWYTGQVSNWKSIANANPALKPERIKIGSIVNIPAELVKKTKPFPKPSLKAKPKVEPQDTQESPAAPSEEPKVDTSTPSNSEVAEAPKVEEQAQAPDVMTEASAPQAAEVDADAPPANEAPVTDEAEREKLREKTRLELLNDVLSSDQPEAAEAAAKPQS